MTTYQNIVSLLEDASLINKELSFGCNLIHKKTGDKLKFIKDADVLLLNFVEGTYNTTENLKEHCEIIGHPPLITDVLRWFKLKDKWNKWFISDTGNLCKQELGEFKTSNFYFNLDTPKLQDQSEEVLKQLEELMLSIINQ